VALAIGEVRERHPERAADARLQVVDLGGETVGRKPFAHAIRFDERTVDLLGGGFQDAVETDSVGGHDFRFGSKVGARGLADSITQRTNAPEPDRVGELISGGSWRGMSSDPNSVLRPALEERLSAANPRRDERSVAA
jgi:hypothetical protein